MATRYITRQLPNGVVLRGSETNDLVTNPPPSVASGKRKTSDGHVRMCRNGGLKSGHVRGHVRKGLFKSDCKFCWAQGRLPRTAPSSSTSRVVQ